jgi:hypothetical protein
MESWGMKEEHSGKRKEEAKRNKLSAFSKMYIWALFSSSEE